MQIPTSKYKHAFSLDATYEINLIMHELKEWTSGRDGVLPKLNAYLIQ